MTDDATSGGDDFVPMHVPTDAELEAVDFSRFRGTLPPDPKDIIETDYGNGITAVTYIDSPTPPEA